MLRDPLSARFEWHVPRPLDIERMREAGAVISSTEMAIYELLRGSGGKEFKEMLQYLK